jgi:hypothetical protein
MSSVVPMPPHGPRILGFGRSTENALHVQNTLRSMGYRATTFALTDEEDGDARLVEHLAAVLYDAVGIGGYINGQDPEHPATDQSFLWFTRILNIVHEHAPGAKIVLNRKPSEALESIERVLGRNDPT